MRPLPNRSVYCEKGTESKVRYEGLNVFLSVGQSIFDVSGFILVFSGDTASICAMGRCVANVPTFYAIFSSKLAVFSAIRVHAVGGANWFPTLIVILFDLVPVGMNAVSYSL